MGIILILLAALFPFLAPAQDKLVFCEKGDIYTAEIDVRNKIRNIRNITNHPAGDYDPVWSPDGRRIAFISNRDGFFTVYITDPYGGNPRPLNKRIKDASDLNWYPDGKRILVDGKLPEGEWMLRFLLVVDIEGKILDKISFRNSFPVGFKLSPDGRYVACHDILKHNISVLDTDTWQLRGITGRDEWGGSMDWLNENVIVFARPEGGEWYMILLALDGRIIRKYPLEGFIYADYPACSPDGNRIIFEGSQKKGKWFLYVLDLNSGKVKNTGVIGASPDWWGGYTSVKPLNLLNTLWSLIKVNGVISSSMTR